MNTKQFNIIVKNFYARSLGVLIAKGQGYTEDKNADRLDHFKRAAAIDGETPEQAAKGMWKKHLVSILDIIKMTETCPKKITEDLIEEKLGDSVNYHGILYALLIERLEEKNDTC